MEIDMYWRNWFGDGVYIGGGGGGGRKQEIKKRKKKDQKFGWQFRPITDKE